MSKYIENTALISAAGAGKTRALTRWFIFLYLHDANYPLDSLYGITFTNEAAFEMKDRILTYLRLLITKKADESERDIIKYFSDAFPDVEERATLKKRYLLSNLSDLKISTFHSLFASFLSSIPFAAGILPGYEIIDETKEAIIFEDVLDKFFEDAYKNRDAFDPLSELMEQQQIRLKDSIRGIFWNILPWLDFLVCLVEKEDSIKKELSVREKKFLETLTNFKDFIRENEKSAYVKNSARIDKHFADLLSKIDEFIQSKDSDLLDGAVFGVDLRTKNYIKKFLSNLGEKATEFDKILADLKITTDTYLGLLSDQQILIHMKPILAIHQHFQKEKQEKNLLSFNDIETYTLEALKNNPEPEYLYFKIGAQIRHLMIDEFQDTSPRQLEILDPLIAEITAVNPFEKSLFYVGDPHQAIFRWRGGTPELFGLLMEKYRGKIKADKLLINYRSKSEIINLVNMILDKNDQAKPGNEGGWIRLENIGDFEDKETGEEEIRKRVAAIIEDLYGKYGYEYADIAILVRTNKFGVAMAEELMKRKIPCVSKSRAVILNDNDVRFILNLLKFLEDPENDFALMDVLLAPVFGLKEETLRNVRLGKKLLFLNLTKLHPEWEVTKKLKNLLSIVHFCNPYELIYRIYKELQIKISYPLATLLDVALDYTRGGFSSLSSFIDWLEKAGDAIEIKEVHPEGVKILTIHKAKGLEFEVVIIPETNWRLKYAENTQLLFSYQEKGAKPEKIYWRRYGKYFKQLREEEKERLRNDELNLLYVALTRAKNGIYMLGFNHPKNGLGFWFNVIAEKLEETDISIGEVIKKIRIEAKEREERPYGRISEQPMVLREERSLYSPTERGVEIIESSRRKSMELGTMIHNALSRIGWLDNIDVKKEVDKIVHYIKDTYARIPEEEIEIEDYLRPILEATLMDSDLRFLFYQDNRKINYKNELPIYFEETKTDISAHIDRLLICPDEIVIIDYKTGTEKPEYKHQMRVYKKGVEQIYPDKRIRSILVYLERDKGTKIVEA